MVSNTNDGAEKIMYINKELATSLGARIMYFKLGQKVTLIHVNPKYCSKFKH